MINRIELSVQVSATVARTWEFLTLPEYVSKWYAFDGTEIDLRVGGLITFQWKEHGKFFGQVEHLNAPNELAFRFVGHKPNERPQMGNSTLVEITLESNEDKTWLTLVESGFLDLDNPMEGDVSKAEISLEGWRDGLEALCTLALQS